MFDVTSHNYTINMFPQPKELSRILSKTLQTFSWKEFIVLYENEDSISRLSSILHYNENINMKIPIYRLPPTSEYESFIKYLSKLGINHYVIDCSTQSWLKFINESMQFNMTKQYIVSENVSIHYFRWSNIFHLYFRIISLLVLICMHSKNS